MLNVVDEHPVRQPDSIHTETISPSDRRLLLGAYLGLLLRRLRQGLAVQRDEILRIADLADRDAGIA